MNRILSLIALLALAPMAEAAPTSIASQPLLNIDGSGSVKPNLMIIYDNSGSMAFDYTPDYVDDSTTCRSRSTLLGGSRSCALGDPPFASADFNKQYYNPALRYLPPVDDLGTSYKSMTKGNTSDWKSVPTDGFREFVDGQSTKTNLVTGYPDLSWCYGSDCRRNTLGYTYPNDVYTQAASVTGNPYYYTLRVSEYCTDATLTNCVSVGVGAPAPANYPVPAPLRWCNSKALTTCQAKYVSKDGYKYPRFSDPAVPSTWYATITIGATKTTQKASIDSVEAVGPNGTLALTGTEVIAASGTDTATKRGTAANDLAAAIMAKFTTTVALKSRPADLYIACLRNATNSVAACSSYGISLPSTSMVAVVPVNCPVGKSASSCTLVDDGSRAEESIVVSASNKVTAILTIAGTANNKAGEAQVLSGLSIGSTKLFDKVQLGSGASSSNVAKAIADAIGKDGAIKGYVGNTSNVSKICTATNSASAVCIVSEDPARDGQNLGYAELTYNDKSKTTKYLALSATMAAVDGIPTVVGPMGGSAFTRTDIVAGKTYPKTAARSDCAGGTCSYDEEMTNFANWYAYYRTRNQMMKTSVGHAFKPIGENYNVGIVSLSVAAAEGDMANRPKPFIGADRKAWYKTLYGMSVSGSTPLRQALHAVGKMYANKKPYAYAAKDAVVQFPCQQNFTFLTTDGYWNGAAAGDVVSNDNVDDESRFCTKATGCLDKSEQTANSLADVALYWYNGGSNDKSISLRADLEGPKGVVKGAAGENTRLHMNTYTLGLGVDGMMTYSKTYQQDVKDGKASSDLVKIIKGVSTGCPWNNGGAYTWPDPATGDADGGASYQSRVDDLWHAAINGHGQYFAASDRQEVIDSLQDALSHIEEKSGAAAAAATSTPNVSAFDNALFSATFTTVKWFGELQGRKINPMTGVVETGSTWTSSAQVGSKVSAAADTRKIYMFDTASNLSDPDATKLKNFTFDAMNSDEQKWFTEKCASFTQCPKLNADEAKTVNDGRTIVNWLRGQQQHANNVLLRAYSNTADKPGGPTPAQPLVLGDIASSKPAYVRDPRKMYTLEGYTDYQAKYSGRAATVYVGANDGMLHAFDATNGEELWAYAPRITMKKLYRQADLTYGTNGHQFTVDGSPEVADVKIGTEWRTVLVGGLNGGGRGYYALDVTDPKAPKALWELCADKSVCAKYDEDIGLTFGNPQFGVWKDASGTKHWVVFLTSGYNNIPNTDGVAGGSGKSVLYVIDVATGAKLVKTVVDAGDDATQRLETPSGLARITAITENPHTDPVVTYVYGGDNLGRMWRFDFTAGGEPKVVKMLDAGADHPITTRPDVTMCQLPGMSDGLQRVVAFGTGRLLDQKDIKLTNTQSAYVLADHGKELGPVPVASLAKKSLKAIAGIGYDISGPAPDLTKDDGGWTVEFDQNTGERVNLDPKIVDNVFNIVTNVPSESSSCQVGGSSKVYQLHVCTGKPVGEVVVGEGTNAKTYIVAGQNLSDDAAAVGSIVISLPSGERKQLTTNADGKIITTRAISAAALSVDSAGWRRVRD